MSSRPLVNWLLASLPLLLVLALCMFTLGSEEGVRLFFREHRAAHPALKAVFKAITTWGNPLFYCIWAWILYRAWKTGDKARKRFVYTYLAVQIVISLITVRFMKMIIGRPRPGEGMMFEPFSTKSSMHALPSGHTTEISVQALSLAMRSPQFWFTLLMALAVALVGFSRIYLGVHHPSDVFFGWLLGSVGAVAIHILSPRFEK